MKKFYGTRTTKAATPTYKNVLDTSSHIFGMNPRKHKLTEMSGTNIPKAIKGSAAMIGPRMPKASAPAASTAPYKHDVQFSIGVGGPGFNEIQE